MRFVVDKKLSCALVVSLTMATSSWARDLDEQVNFSIPPQKLDSALVEFSKQAKLQIVSSGVEIMDVSSAGATGSLTIYDALMRLLQSSGLSFRAIGDSAISIGRFKEGGRTSSAAADRSAGNLNALVQFDIQEKPLAQALMDLSAQSGLNVVAPSSLTMGKKGAQVRGDMSAEDALRRVLRGSGLTFIQWEDGTIAIQAQAAALRLGNEGLVQANDGESDLDKDSTQDVKLEEVIVSAQRRDERLQDVPMSVSVMSGADLDSATFSGATDAIRTLPGVDTGSELYNGGIVISVRGVSNATARAGGAGPIGYYIDGVPYGFVRSAFYPDPSIYDLKRVEFVAGPQGTLYGAGSLNGVLRILTENANADRFEFKARTAYSETSSGGDNYRGDFAVNVPVVDGRLGVRAIVGYQNDSGWIDAPNAQDVNDSERRNYRLKIHGQPSDTLSLDLSAWHSERDTGGPSIGNDAGRQTVLTPQPQFENFSTYGLEVNKIFPLFNLSSMTSYIDYDNGGIIDGNASAVNATLDTRFDARVFSQELNLVSNLEGTWRWSAGAFYRDTDNVTYQFLDWIPVATADALNNDYTDTSKSWAVYGELGRNLTDTLSLSAGLRYFTDEQETRINQRAPSYGTIPFTPFESTSEATTPRVVLTWAPNAHQNFYATYSQGFRSGFAQQPNVQARGGFPPVEPDRLINYELGAKGSLIDGRLYYEVAAYYIDWQDIQQNVGVTIPSTGLQTTATVNGEGASGPGASLAMRFHPISRLELSANVTWSDLAFDGDIFSGATLLFRKGDRPTLSPEYTAGASIQTSWPIGSGGYEGRFAISGNYKSPQNETATTGRVETDDILTANVRFSLAAAQNWLATFFVDNLTDNDRSPARAVLFNGNTEWSPRMRPRTVGAQLEYAFK